MANNITIKDANGDDVTVQSSDNANVQLPAHQLRSADGSSALAIVAGVASVSAAQSGTWTVQPGNTANTTPWLASIAEGGNTAQVTADSGGALQVAVVAGASGGTSSSFGAAFPATGTAVGMSDSTNMVPFTTTDGTSLDVAVIGNATVVQPSAASLNATVIGAGSAGTANAGVVTVQGIASMTPVQVSQATASNLNAQAVGNAASGASDSGNPVKVGGRYNSTPPTFTDGQRGDLQLDANGYLRVAVAASPATNISTNIAQVAGASVQVGNGTASGSLRVSLANDSTGVLATVGTVTTVSTVTSVTQNADVRQATAGNLNATVVGTGTFAVQVSSQVPGTGATNLGKAEDAGHTTGDTGVMALGVANTALAAISGTTLDYTPFATNLDGRVITMIAPPAAMTRGTATTTNTSDVSLVAASGSGSLRTYITAVQIANTGASTSLITFKDGNGGSTLGYTIAPAGGGSNITFDVPLMTTANTAFYFTAGTSSTTIYASAQGYLAP